MTLQFDPSPYLAAFQYGQNRDQQARNTEAQGIQGIGQGIGQLAQIPGQQRDERMSQLMAAMKLKEQGVDPGSAMSWLQTGKFPNSQPTGGGSSVAPTNPMPMFGQTPSADGSFSSSDPTSGPSIPPQQPAGFSDTISKWKQATATPNHPYLPQGGNAPQPTAQPTGGQPSGFGSLFQSPKVDYGNIVKGMDQGDYSGYQGLNEKQRGDVEKIREYNSNKQDRQLKDKELQGYRSQMVGLAKGKSDQQGGKDDTAALKDLQDQYNKNPNVQKAQGSLDKLETARALLQAGVTDNATAKQALQTALTYVATGGQRVNEAELRQFGGAQTVTNKAGQWLKQLDSGTLTPRDAQDMQGVISIYEKGAKRDLQNIGMSHAKQLSQRTGKDASGEYKRITGDDFQNLDNPDAGTPGGGMKIGRFNVTVH